MACKYGLWSAAGLISYTSDTGYIDFRAWLISQGKKSYYATLKDPDTLADLDSGDGYWFESFTYAGYFALEDLTEENAYDNMSGSTQNRILAWPTADVVSFAVVGYDCALVKREPICDKLLTMFISPRLDEIAEPPQMIKLFVQTMHHATNGPQSQRAFEFLTSLSLAQQLELCSIFISLRLDENAEFCKQNSGQDHRGLGGE